MIYMNAPDSVQVIGDAFPEGCIVTYAQSPSSIIGSVQKSVTEIV